MSATALNLESWEDPKSWSDEKLSRKIRQEKDMARRAAADNDMEDCTRRMNLATAYGKELEVRQG